MNPSDLLAVLALSDAVAACLIVLRRRRCPEGHEDESGFHFCDEDKSRPSSNYSSFIGRPLSRRHSLVR